VERNTLMRKTILLLLLFIATTFLLLGCSDTNEPDIEIDTSIEYPYDFHAWALGCSAVLATRNNYDPYEFGMYEKNKKNATLAKMSLRLSWDCRTRNELYNTILDMTDNGDNADFAEIYEISSRKSFDDIDTSEEFDEEYSILANEGDTVLITKAIGDKWGDKQIKAWDWYRTIHLAGWGYIAGYLELEEAHALMGPVIGHLHDTFSSWEEATDNYMDGYYWWTRHEAKDSAKEYKIREDILLELRAMPPETNLFDPTVWE